MEKIASSRAPLQDLWFDGGSSRLLVERHLWARYQPNPLCSERKQPGPPQVFGKFGGFPAARGQKFRGQNLRTLENDVVLMVLNRLLLKIHRLDGCKVCPRFIMSRFLRYCSLTQGRVYEIIKVRNVIKQHFEALVAFGTVYQSAGYLNGVLCPHLKTNVMVIWC